MKRAVLSTLLLLSAVGCTSNDSTARLTVRGANQDTAYTTAFDRAYFAQNAAGDTDLVLLGGDERPGETNGLKVRQVVHVRVLWQPTHTIRVDSPSSANAMIDWNVIADDRDRVSYAGSCWANVSVDGDVATVDLRNADVSVRRVIGRVNDPLKRASLSGRFVATRSDAAVRASMDELAGLDHPSATAALDTPGPAATP